MTGSYDQGSKDPFGIVFAFFLVIIVIYCLFLYLWSNHSQTAKDLVLTSAYYLRWVQIPFSPILSDVYNGALYNLPNLYNDLLGTQYQDIFFSLFLKISLRSVGIIFFIILIPRGVYLIINNDRINFSRSLTLFDLIKIKRELHPRIKPTTARNLLQEDARFGSLASQLNPIDLIIHRGFIDLVSPTDIDDEAKRYEVENKLENITIANLKHPNQYLKNIQGMSYIEYANLRFPTGNVNSYDADIKFLFESIDHYHGLLKVSRDSIKKYLISTLGPRCRYNGKFIDITLLPVFERALWVLFMACIAQKSDLRKDIETMLDQMANTFVEGEYNSNDHQMNLEGIDDIYEKCINVTKVRIELARISKSHGYYYTAFTALYTAAKKNYGTITSQDFRWLRITNRILFYSLNQIGLERARYEASGVRSHYLAELKNRRSMGQRIGMPQVDSAVLNIIGSLDMESWTAIPQTYEDLDPSSPTFMRRLWIDNKSDSASEASAHS